MHNMFGEDHKVPSSIPFYFCVTTLRSKRGTAQAIGIHVGTLHKEFLDTIIKQSPFPDIELVLFSLRRKIPAQFEKHIQLHEYICNNSCAIKLLRTSEESCEALRHEASKDTTIEDKIIKMDEASKTQLDGTFYIQCLHEHKPLV